MGKTKVKAIIIGALLLTVIFALVGGAFAQEPPIFEKGLPTAAIKGEYVPWEFIVKFKPGVSDEMMASVNSRHGSFVLRTSPRADFKVLRVPRGKTSPEMVELYRQNPNVEYAEPNYLAYAHWSPNDPLYYLQWHLDNPVNGGINMEEAWNIETGDPSVIVAVVDSGVAYENYTEGIWYWRVYYYKAPDLAQTSFVPGYDFVNNDSHPNDDYSHGTHVAGTIAQSTNNSIGVAGVAFDCSIMPIKVLDSNGQGTYADLANGIYWATDHGADVINLSLGGTDYSATLEDACEDAYNHGVIVVASAGNEGHGLNRPMYPAAYDDYVIAVGATRYDETRCYYSNTGSHLDLVAPGGQVFIQGTTDILDQNGDLEPDGVLQQTFNPITKDTSDFGWWFFEGTSMAAPHVSGVAALVISNGVATAPDDVREVLQSTAEEHGAPGWDAEYGWGIVDAYDALTWTPGDTTPPYTTGHNPAPGATGVPIGTDIVVHVLDAGDGVDSSTIVMSVDGSPVIPTITGTLADYTVTYDPPSDFGYAQTVPVSVDADDLAGNPMSTPYSWSFTTQAAPDTTPPYTSGHDPAPDATGVPIGTNIVVHVLDAGDGVDSSTIAMSVDGSPVIPAITGTLADYTVTYNPPSDFGYEQTVPVSVDADDLAGNPMSTPDSWSFTTQAAPDTTPPYTAGHDPAKGATGVPIGTDIVVHVLDDGDGVDSSTIVMSVDGSPVIPTITGSPADYTLTYDPPSDFGYEQTVPVSVDADDLAGNPMPTPDSWSFTTQAAPPPFIYKAGSATTDGGTATVAFTTPFPDTDYAIVLTAENPDDTTICMYSSKTTGGFTIITQDDDGNAESSVTVDWVAISYSNS